MMNQLFSSGGQICGLGRSSSFMVLPASYLVFKSVFPWSPVKFYNSWITPPHEQQNLKKVVCTIRNDEICNRKSSFVGFRRLLHKPSFGFGGLHSPQINHRGYSTAGEKLLSELKGIKRMPWDHEFNAEQSSKKLGEFLGISDLKCGEVIALDAKQLEELLRRMESDSQLEQAVFGHADGVTRRFFGDNIYYRGIVEFSNVCQNDCGYCGIRKHQHGVQRYTVPIEEVLEVAVWAYNNKMGTLMLQSGELKTKARMNYLLDLIHKVRQQTSALPHPDPDPPTHKQVDSTEKGLCVALSVGELPMEQYQELMDAGAQRYLLRIETSNPDLYSGLHPQSMKWDSRVECLQNLKQLGFMVGTGVMVGLPCQTYKDLAQDIVFFREIGADMIGMGPYITEAGTPVADMWQKIFGDRDKDEHMKQMFQLTTRMNALARITLGNVNIAATTALQAIDPMGREIALQRGANILMPILTPTKYRINYQLYEGKPCITDTADECRNCLNARVSMIGKKLKGGVWGNPPHFLHPVIAPTAAAGTRGFSTTATKLQKASAKQTPAKGSDVQRVNIGVFGAMNAGKSTLMNSITRSDSSIVDATPGTTADTKTVLMELHDIGPVKLFDTAGVDESGELGEKKRRKVISTLKESDLAVIVIDMIRIKGIQSQQGLYHSLAWERMLLEKAQKHDCVPMLLFNVREELFDEDLNDGAKVLEILDPQDLFMKLTLNLTSSVSPVSDIVSRFLQDGHKRCKDRQFPKSLPEEFLSEDAMVFLNIPMDAETPTMRLLRPQALVQEECIRNFVTTIAYRMNLNDARSGDEAREQHEKKRFLKALEPVLAHKGPKILVTDSQAVDIVHPWTLDLNGNELINFTTFSIAMIHRQSGARLPLFAKGVETLQNLQSGDKILIAEACNHNRITETCNDIGMVQIPQKLKDYCKNGLQLEHAFGREFPDLDSGLNSYKLAIHCGGCMIDHQKMRARISDLEEAKVPVTNYGLFLSYVTSPYAMQRALQPWGLHFQVEKQQQS